ncbi:hypothetical protein EVG20_g3010 [Dentipellis fragilis]|uniref:Uncharacterized protein n=1 Tax=Dentipellis fragilis TaxID=205917 RepID=A0A4Y9Z521_9AGAM|nr:hypothetical protein EVG20_g3010 [Dentipellis fragilis]
MASTRSISRGGPAKSYMFGLPRGLSSLRIFDNSAPPATPQPVKAEVPYNPNPDPRQRLAAPTPRPRTNSSSRPSPPQPDPAYHIRGVQQRQRNGQLDHSFKRKNSGQAHGYGIYPSSAKYTYVYESSISSKSDLPSIPDQAKSDADVESILSYGGDVSSIRARSSSETLHSLVAPESLPDSDATGTPSHSPRHIVPANLPALIEAQHSLNVGIINLTLPEGSVSDSDSESTVNGDSYPGASQEPASMDQRAYPMTSTRALPETRPNIPPPSYPPRSAPTAPPRRPEPPVASQPQQRSRRDSVDRAGSGQNQPMYNAAYNNYPIPGRAPPDGAHVFPPGLSSQPSTGISPPSENYHDPWDAQPRRERRDSFSVQPPHPRRMSDATARAGQGSVPMPSRGTESRRDELMTPGPSRANLQRVEQDMRGPPPSTPNARMYQQDVRDVREVRSAPPEPTFTGALVRTQSKGRVRWNENLICPSPIPQHERRKGWFNRRGDQLWTNEGAFRPPSPGQEYPLDLQHYPEPGTGWMSEDGVRIDMQHRLVPKAPLRSALKRSRKPSMGGGNAGPPY